MTMDYRAYPVLFVDDEQQNLVAFRYALEEQFQVLTASSGEEAMTLLQQHDVAVMLADQRMPGMSGVELCRRARTLRPDAIRIIITAYADLHAAIDAINDGQVSRYLTKPWRNEEVAEVLRTALELFHLTRTVRDMEMRLLRGGQSTTAFAIQEELAHELSNPLSALALNGQLLLDLLDAASSTTEAGTSLGKLLATARETQQDCMMGIEQLRALAARLRRGQRPSSSALATCDAARVIDSTARILRRELERVAHVEVSLLATPTVPLDACALGQIMLNLLLNAAQAIEAANDGDAERSRDNHRINIEISSDGHRAQITVSDTGTGVSKEQHYRIFDPYVTTKADSSGIGLAIVRDLVIQAGGEIEIQSAPGEGATFVVILPATSVH